MHALVVVLGELEARADLDGRGEDERLAGLELFELLSEEDRLQLSESIRRREVAAGDTLFQSGEPGDSLFVVRAGQMELSIKDRTRSFSARCSGCVSPGSPSSMRSASVRVISMIFTSLRRATFSPGSPDCFVPKNWPGPRISMSASASSKPSVVSSISSRRRRASSLGSSDNSRQ